MHVEIFLQTFDSGISDIHPAYIIMSTPINRRHASVRTHRSTKERAKMMMVGGTTLQSHFRITRLSISGSMSSMVACDALEPLACETENRAFSSAMKKGGVDVCAIVTSPQICRWAEMAFGRMYGKEQKRCVVRHRHPDVRRAGVLYRLDHTHPIPSLAGSFLD